MYNEKTSEKENEVNYNYLGPQDNDPDPGFPNYVERHLIIEDNQFIIVPNGGTGDCLFKAIAQAMSDEDDEACHLDIRCKVVDFVILKMWDNLKDSIEIQHICGNSELIELWTKDPVQCYREYMTQGGTLGSFIELTAAAELLQFSFSSIQEYSKDVKTYRVENFDGQIETQEDGRPHYYFLFTGDYESGHWEHLVPLVTSCPKGNLDDGTYHGVLYIVIDGVQTSVDDWLSDVDEKSKQLTDRGNGESDKTESEAESARDADQSSSTPPPNDTIEDCKAEISDAEGNLALAQVPQQSSDDRLPQRTTKSNQLRLGTSSTWDNQGSFNGNDNDDDDGYDDYDEDDWEETLSTKTTATAAENPALTPSGPIDDQPIAISTYDSSARTRSKRKVISRLFGSTTTATMASRSRGKSETMTVETDKKKGCFKSFVSYVSSMLR